MTRDQVVDLLTLMASYDRRTVGKADVRAWWPVVGDLDFDDAARAVIGHYGESTDWAMPAHIRRRAAQMRRERAERVAEPLVPPELTDDGTAYIAALRRALRAAMGELGA